MSRASRSWTMQPALPEWAAVALLLSTLALEGWDLWGEMRSQQAQPVTREDCFGFCGWSGTQPKAWGSYSCECYPPEGR